MKKMNKILPIILVVVLFGCSSDVLWTKNDQIEWDSGYDIGYSGDRLSKSLNTYSNNFIDGYEWGDALADCEFYQLTGDWDAFENDDCAEEFNLGYPKRANKKQGDYDTSITSCEGRENNWNNCLGYARGRISLSGSTIYSIYKNGHAFGYGHIHHEDYEYHGNLHYNRMNGKGTIVWKTGNYDVGIFRDNTFDGKFVRYNPNGKVTNIFIYKRGKLLSNQKVR